MFTKKSVISCKLDHSPLPGTDGSSIDIFNVVDIRSTRNKEVGLRIHTDVENTNRVFYSDLNGFQVIHNLFRFFYNYTVNDSDVITQYSNGGNVNYCFIELIYFLTYQLLSVTERTGMSTFFAIPIYIELHP